jgi:hypothetical protein
MKHELQNIISGKSQVSYGDAIQKIASYLKASKSTGRKTEPSQPIKSQETTFIKQFCDLEKNCFFTYCNFTSLFGYNPKEVLMMDFLMEMVKFNQEVLSDLGSWKMMGVDFDGVLGIK